MPAILADKVKLGMKLCQALYTIDGKVYLPAGTVINKKLLAELGRGSYKYVRVDSASFSQEKASPSASDIEDQLEKRFSRVDLSPFLRLIKETLKAEGTKGARDKSTAR